MNLRPLKIVIAAARIWLASGTGRSAGWSVADHGALGDGKTNNTRAIQATIDACAAAGGGTVEIPRGVFVTGAVFFKTGVALEVDAGAVLKGSINLDDYPQVKTRWEGTEREWTAALLNFSGMQAVAIRGDGTVDGSGTEFPRYQRRTPAASEVASPMPSPASTPAQPASPRRGRPRLLAIQNCNDVHVENLHLKDQASWCVFVLYSKNVTLENLDIRAEHTIPSSDGIDIDSCNGVHVVGCSIDVNDDCISIKSGKDEEGRRINRPAENILIEKTHFGYGHGGVAMGSEVSGGIRHVEVRDCVVDSGNWAAVRFKSQPSRGGVIEDIVYRNITIHDARMAVEFNLAWRLVPPLPPPASPLTEVRGVKLINVSGTVKSAGSIRGLPEGPIRDVTFTNCHLEADTGLSTECIQKLDTSGLTLQVKSGPEILHK